MSYSIRLSQWNMLQHEDVLERHDLTSITKDLKKKPHAHTVLVLMNTFKGDV